MTKPETSPDKPIGRPRALDENQEQLLVRRYWLRKLGFEQGTLDELRNEFNLSHRAMLDMVDRNPELKPTPDEPQAA